MSGQHQRLPIEVDPLRLAAREELLQGKIPLNQMKRLLSALSSNDGEIFVDVGFTVDINRVVILAGQIKTDLKLICQRCMREMPLVLDIEFQLAFVRSEAEMERLPEGYEATILDNNTVMLSDIIEDELLLALPSIPKHPDDSCSSDVLDKVTQNQQENAPDTENVERDNPFDILASLKTDK
ncbi:MAG: YceD family protein [Woeseiaceae bacterium]